MQQFQDEDQKLFEAIEAYKKGNGDKATIIYESTKKYTFNILHKGVERYKNQGALTSDVVSITEDIMQELYIEFFNKIANFRNEDSKSIFKWISVVAQRRLRTYVKENGTEVLQFEKDEDFREEGGIWDSSEINDSDMESNHELLPEAALEDKEFRELILDFIQSLPEAQAQTILLHFRGGMKYQEIADEMGVSLITVKTRMKKAKDSLEEIITKYEKKTGTKLHSVSILPLLWLLYRMASEETVVPAAVDTAVTGSLAGASSVAGASGVGIGGATTVGSVATKAISTRVLVAIVSTAVAIGGVAVGSHLIDKKQETTIEQGDSEDKELDNESDDNTSSKGDSDTENETADSNANNQTQDENSVSDIATNNNGTGENSNETESNTGENSNTTDGNTGAGENSNTTGGNTGAGENTNETGGNTNNSGNGDSGSESTAAKGTKENPYRIGEKIVVSEDIVYNGSQDNSNIYHLEITVTGYTPISEYYASGHTYSSFPNMVQAKIKLLGDDTEPREKTPIMLGAELADGRSFNASGSIQSPTGAYIDEIYTNVEYDIGLHFRADYFTEDSVITYYTIGYFKASGGFERLYVKLE